MSARLPIVERLRERVEGLRRRIRGQAGVRSQIQLGKGALIERGREIITKTTERIQELKPGIVPKIGQVLSEWYPGKRLVQVVTPKTQVVRPGEITQTPAKEEFKEPQRIGAHY